MDRVEIPDEFVGLRHFLGEGVVAEHYVSRLLGERDGLEVARWLDRRYRVLLGALELDDARQEELKRGLRGPTSFLYGDAEVQAAASMLTRPGIAVAAPDGRGERAPDFVAKCRDGEVDVEVRVLHERAWVLKLDQVRNSLADRLEPISRAKSCPMMLQVRRVQAEDGALLLTPDKEKALQSAVHRELNQNGLPQQEKLIVLDEDGQATTWNGRTTLHGALAWVRLQPSALWPAGVLAMTGLRRFKDAEATFNALKKKRNRGQRQDGRAWIVVLDGTCDPDLDPEAVGDGIRRFLGQTETISAVVFQRRRVALKQSWAGLVLSFRSRIVPNERATHPIPDELLTAFDVDDRLAIPPGEE